MNAWELNIKCECALYYIATGVLFAYEFESKIAQMSTTLSPVVESEVSVEQCG